MAREVQIITWCDHCLTEGRQTEATEYAGLNSAGARVSVDLCQGHVDAFIAPTLALFDRLGRAAEGKVTRVHRKSTAAPGPCPECDKEFHSAQSLGMHRWRKHGVPSQNRAAKETQQESVV